MIITLIALVILLIGGVALIRSFDTSMLLAGNLAFKRDLVNQGERGMAQAIGTLNTGGALSSEAARQADNPASNYSASLLASDSHGIPLALINNAAFTMTGADITDAGAGVTIRYVIDRQCSGAGTASDSTCNGSFGEASRSGSEAPKGLLGGEFGPVYRISVRVNGPRNTQTYLQSTLTIPLRDL